MKMFLALLVLSCSACFSSEFRVITKAVVDCPMCRRHVATYGVTGPMMNGKEIVYLDGRLVYKGADGEKWMPVKKEDEPPTLTGGYLVSK